MPDRRRPSSARRDGDPRGGPPRFRSERPDSGRSDSDGAPRRGSDERPRGGHPSEQGFRSERDRPEGDGAHRGRKGPSGPPRFRRNDDGPFSPTSEGSRPGKGQGSRARSQPPEAGDPKAKRFAPRYEGASPRRAGTDARAAATAQPIDGPMRLNRFLARAGVAARRKADEMIAAGAVAVNGRVVTEMGVQVQPGDVVTVNGRPVTPTEHLYLLLNKPDDFITTKDDERGRATVLDLIGLPEAEKGALFPVGRLDRHTTGVLLLTTDGELAHRLLHPSYGVKKYYRIRTRDTVKPHDIEALKAGVMLDDGPATPDNVGYIALPDYHELGMLLHEGRNRIVRRMMEALGHEVVELERVRYADLTSEGVRRGKWRRLTPVEVKRLRRLVKL